MELVIGSRRWSSWSLRPWLALRRSGLAFTVREIALRQPGDATAREIAPHSPSGRVPVLKDGEVAVWESLAICEYLAERSPGLWPADPAARARARAAAVEMAAGFQPLRAECPMDLKAAPAPLALSEATQANVRRIVALWLWMLDRSGGPYLAGDWSIADAFYTPVATRFRTYAVDLAAHGDDGRAAAYAARLLADPDFQAWAAAA